MIRVGISGIHYPLSMMLYFIRAFQRRSDVELYTVGPFTGTWIPWNNGMEVKSKYLHIPTIQLPKEVIGYSVPFSNVSKKLPEHFDLWLEIDAGWHFSDRPKADCVCLIETDPHVLRKHYDQIYEREDIIFCMQSNYMPPKEKYYFLPYAYDPTVHYPEESEKLYDACLIGLLYDTRKQLIEALRNRGKRVYYNIGEIFDEYRKRYCSSKVALSWSSLKDTPARVWEAFAMKVPLVSNFTPDLIRFFGNGEHFLGFLNLAEAIENVEYLLDDPEFASKMADNAYEAVKNHTWDARVETILKTTGYLE